MWGVNGGYVFLAEEAGATRVKAVDTLGPTPEFEQEHGFHHVEHRATDALAQTSA